jgi:hypothetical protein
MKLLFSLLLLFSQPVCAAFWDNNFTWQVTVGGTARYFRYTDAQSIAADGSYTLSKTWGWDGWDASTGGSYVTWDAFHSGVGDEPSLNAGGFPEYATEAPWMLKVRRPPGLRVSVPAGMQSFTFSGTFALAQPTVPPSGYYMSGQQTGLTLAPEAPLATDYGTEITQEAYSALFGGSVDLFLSRPAMVVVAEDNSWSWRSPITIRDWSSFFWNLTRVTDMMNSGLTGDRAPVAVIVPFFERTRSVNFVVPVPWGWSGNVRVFLTGFMSDWHAVTPTYRASYTSGSTTYPATWWRRDHRGTAILPSTLSNATLTFQKKDLSGSVTLPSYLTPGATGNIPLSYELK